MKTSLSAGNPGGSVSRRENWRQPGGESHWFAPRPRPESWNVARERNGVASPRRMRGFLRSGKYVGQMGGARERSGAHLSSIVCVLVTASP